jgi:hypothetical protein
MVAYPTQQGSENVGKGTTYCISTHNTQHASILSRKMRQKFMNVLIFTEMFFIKLVG